MPTGVGLRDGEFLGVTGVPFIFDEMPGPTGVGLPVGEFFGVTGFPANELPLAI